MGIDLDTIRCARDLLADESRWCRADMARDRFGNNVHPAGLRAVQWCAEGSLHAAMNVVKPHSSYWYSMRGRLEWAAEKVAGRTISLYRFNDTCTHSELMGMFDVALRGLVALKNAA